MATYSLFDSSTPTFTNNPGDQSYTLGVIINSSVAGNVTGVRFYASTGGDTSVTVGIWNAVGTLLASKAGTASVPGWNVINFDAPVAITAGVNYTVGRTVSSGSFSYPSTNNYYPLNPGLVVGPLTVPQSGGVFVLSGSLVRPTSAFNDSNYWVDYVLDDTPPGGSEAPTKTYNGSTFTERNVKTWNGASWTTRRAKRWNGTSWN